MKIVAFWCDKCDYCWIQTNQNEVKRWEMYLNHEWWDTTSCINENCDNTEVVYSIRDERHNAYEEWLLEFDIDSRHKNL